MLYEVITGPYIVLAHLLQENGAVPARAAADAADNADQHRQYDELEHKNQLLSDSIVDKKLFQKLVYYLK